jgi:hypothetical protein
MAATTALSALNAITTFGCIAIVPFALLFGSVITSIYVVACYLPFLITILGFNATDRHKNDMAGQPWGGIRCLPALVFGCAWAALVEHTANNCLNPFTPVVLACIPSVMVCFLITYAVCETIKPKWERVDGMSDSEEDEEEDDSSSEEEEEEEEEEETGSSDREEEGSNCECISTEDEKEEQEEQKEEEEEDDNERWEDLGDGVN